MVRVSGATYAGRGRSGNQDTFLITTFGGGVLLLVCDGMGGAAGGAVASHLAASAITLGLRERWSEEAHRNLRFPACLGEAVVEANRIVHRRARVRATLAGMGTTVTAAGITGNVAYLAQVGDSRAHLVRGGQVMRLTRNQTVAHEMFELGLLSSDEAERSPYRHVLSRSIGPEPSVEPELTSHDLKPDDVLVLSTDGLANVVGDAELAAEVQSASTPAIACRRLLTLAREREPTDDVTVVVGYMGFRRPEPSARPSGARPFSSRPPD